MQISNSPALIGNLEKDAMRAYLGSYHFVEKSAANDQWYAPMISSSFRWLPKAMFDENKQWLGNDASVGP